MGKETTSQPSKNSKVRMRSDRLLHLHANIFLIYKILNIK